MAWPVLHCWNGNQGRVHQPLQALHNCCQLAVPHSPCPSSQDNLQHLPCHPSSTWLQQLMHLGNNLARIQALMTALPTTNGPDSSKVRGTRHSNACRQV